MRATFAYLCRLLGLGLLGWVPVRAATAPAAAEPPTDAAADRTKPEYKIKAVFLFNFSQFVDWPSRAFVRPDSPFVIGVLGEDPFGAYLDDLVRGERVGGRAISVVRLRAGEDATACHILFICRSEAGRLPSILDGLRGRPVLTVSDIDRFALQGGMVRFATEQGKIRLRINPAAAKAEGLTISSKILRAATLVSTERD